MINLLEMHLKAVVKLFVQANMTLDDEDFRNFLSPQDIMELIDLSEEEVHKQLHTTVVSFYKGDDMVITGHNRYQKDRYYEYYWKTVLDTVSEINNTAFLRAVKLTNSTKFSSPVMVKRFNGVIIAKIIHIFQQLMVPTEVEWALCTPTQNPFAWLRKEFTDTDPNTHPDNIRVARKLITRMSV